MPVGQPYPKKRSRSCPKCSHGRAFYCDNCGSPYPCPGVPPLLMDGKCLRKGPSDTRSGSILLRGER